MIIQPPLTIRASKIPLNFINTRVEYSAQENLGTIKINEIE